jgi:hypothetical protein
MRLIFGGESGAIQFRWSPRGGGAVTNPYLHDQLWYGEEMGQPLFGAPHGYGVAQLDTPRPGIDQVYSFLETIRFARTC